MEKHEEYAQFGIPEYWIADFLMGTFSVLNLTDGIYTEQVHRETEPIMSQLFPDLTLSLNQIMTSIN